MQTDSQTETAQHGSLHPAGYAISKTGSVWMLDNEACCSAERAIAVDAMMALGLDPNDWRTRDKLIQAISPRVTGMLDYAHNAEVSDGGPLTHESPAAQSRRSLH